MAVVITSRCDRPRDFAHNSNWHISSNNIDDMSYTSERNENLSCSALTTDYLHHYAITVWHNSTLEPFLSFIILRERYVKLVEEDCGDRRASYAGFRIIHCLSRSATDTNSLRDYFVIDTIRVLLCDKVSMAYVSRWSKVPADVGQRKFFPVGLMVFHIRVIQRLCLVSLCTWSDRRKGFFAWSNLQSLICSDRLSPVATSQQPWKVTTTSWKIPKMTRKILYWPARLSKIEGQSALVVRGCNLYC